MWGIAFDAEQDPKQHGRHQPQGEGSGRLADGLDQRRPLLARRGRPVSGTPPRDGQKEPGVDSRPYR